MAVHAPFALWSITYSIISSQASFVIGPLDIQYINMPYVVRYSYGSLASPDHVACVIFAKTLTLANSSYYTLWIAVLGYHTDAFDALHQSFWLSSALSVWDTHKQSHVLSSWDTCPDLAIICFKEVSFNAGSPTLELAVMCCPWDIELVAGIVSLFFCYVRVSVRVCQSQSYLGSRFTRLTRTC